MPSAAGAGLPPVSVLFQGKEKSLGILSKYMEIHGTVYYESQRPPEVPAFVKNHGLLPQPEFQQLLRKAKVSPPPAPSPSQPATDATRAPACLSCPASSLMTPSACGQALACPAARSLRPRPSGGWPEPRAETGCVASRGAPRRKAQ